MRGISVTAGFSMRVSQKVFNEVRIAGTRSIRKPETRSTSSDYEILILAVEIGPLAWQALFSATPVYKISVNLTHSKSLFPVYNTLIIIIISRSNKTVPCFEFE